MSKRRPLYAVSSPTASGQTVIEFDAPAPEPVKPAPAPDAVAEQSDPEYTTAPKWVDAAGKTRSWSLLKPDGTQFAEIVTKRDAKNLADFLNDLTSGQRGR